MAVRTKLDTEAIKAVNHDCLTSITGIDDATQHALYKAGYLTFSDLAKASEREIQLALSRQDHRFTSADFSRWTAEATLVSQDDLKTSKKQEVKPATIKSVVDTTTPTAPAFHGDDLTRIRGIGPATAELLKAAGIKTFSALAKAGTPRLQEILDSGGNKVRCG